MLRERERRGWRTLRDLAVMLDEPYSTTVYRVYMGQIPEPTRTLPRGRRKYYSAQEAADVVAAFKEGS
jgi:hypothetical protein